MPTIVSDPAAAMRSVAARARAIARACDTGPVPWSRLSLLRAAELRLLIHIPVTLDSSPITSAAFDQLRQALVAHRNDILIALSFASIASRELALTTPTRADPIEVGVSRYLMLRADPTVTHPLAAARGVTAVRLRASAADTDYFKRAVKDGQLRARHSTAVRIDELHSRALGRATALAAVWGAHLTSGTSGPYEAQPIQTGRHTHLVNVSTDARGNTAVGWLMRRALPAAATLPAVFGDAWPSVLLAAPMIVAVAATTRTIGQPRYVDELSRTHQAIPDGLVVADLAAIIAGMDRDLSRSRWTDQIEVAAACLGVTQVTF